MKFSKKKGFIAAAVVLAVVIIIILFHSSKASYDTHYESYYSGYNFKFKKYMYDNGFDNVHIIKVKHLDVNYSGIYSAYIGHSKDDLWELGCIDGMITIKCNIPGKEDSYLIMPIPDERAKKEKYINMNGDGEEYGSYRPVLDVFNVIVTNVINDPYNMDVTRGVDKSYNTKRKIDRTEDHKNDWLDVLD